MFLLPVWFPENKQKIVTIRIRLEALALDPNDESSKIRGILQY